MIYFTGDTHGTDNILNERLPKIIKEKNNNKIKNFHVIIAGDSGIYFFKNDNEEKTIDLLHNKLKENNITLTVK